MITFFEHPYLSSLQAWALVAIAVLAYFHTFSFTGNPDHNDLDLTWKITTAIMWPACLVIFMAVVIYTTIVMLFGKSSRDKNDH